MPRNIWLFRYFLVISLKASTYQLCSGLQLTSEISGDTNRGDGFFGFDLDFPQSPLVPENLKQSSRNAVEYQGDQPNQVSDHIYDSLGKLDYEPSHHITVSNHCADYDSLMVNMAELTSENPYSLNSHTYDRHHLQPSPIGHTWEATHWITPQVLSGMQTNDIFDSNAYINEYFDYLNNLQTYEDLEKNNQPGTDTCGSHQHSNPSSEIHFSAGQYSHITPSVTVDPKGTDPEKDQCQGKVQEEGILDPILIEGNGVSDQINENPLSYMDSEEMQMGNQSTGLRKETPHFEQNSVVPGIYSPTISNSEKRQEILEQSVGTTNSNSVSMLDGTRPLGVNEAGIFENIGGCRLPDENTLSHTVIEETQTRKQSIGLRQGSPQSDKHSVMESGLYSPTISNSEKWKKKLAKSVGTKQLNSQSISNNASLVKPREMKSQFSENLALNSSHKVIYKKRKLSAIPKHCISKTKTIPDSPNHLLSLQKIGMKNSSRSPILCYEIHEFFREIHEKIKAHHEFSLEEGDSVRLAVRNAGGTVVMVFLGILKVFEGKGYGEDEVELLLNDGWSFMKDFYSNWNWADRSKFGFGKSERYFSQGAFDPDFHLRYLKQIHKSINIPLTFIHSISLLWSKERKKSKIPRDLSEHGQQIMDASNTDSHDIRGGLYERIGIKNHSFWGPAQFLRTEWNIYGDKNSSSHLIWKLASNAAQFHTPAGRDVCEGLHSFFEGLVQKLHMEYNNLNGYHPSKNLPDQADNVLSKKHLDNLSLIVKAVSMAEYRVIVPFIGIITILDRHALTVDQFQVLIQNAIEFVKDIFGKWEHLNFHPSNIHNLFECKRLTWRSHSKLRDSDTMFQTLFGYEDKNGFPTQVILYLLRLWHISVMTSNPGSKNYISFKITEMPHWTVKEWNSSAEKLLANQDPIDIQKWMFFMPQE
ncbi:uncharacterized protein MELLADRAFT_113963 [Melampsora larici-populina 98AG31]|uniref:Secreted protein n=1 Tax=Melampsora larici-populina (strain 98AG31 / pathotype 3-4-7) TaxID=747676 RepID=F4SBP2_MELLP|nr:uncharacterized protein MELLADRAFT_113963 [Melampsora larici-populina 98AG31]EGF97932.1 hypothetical protein MELLADRAFT_113963 [Melampsora larici-populina 98AG31]